MTLNDIKVGDKLIADAGFTCIGSGEVCVVEEYRGNLMVRCKAGTHCLDGQLNDDGEIVGFKRA